MASKPAHETRIDADAPLEFVMPGETNDPDIASEQFKGIPLYLIWTVIKEQIEKKREVREQRLAVERAALAEQAKVIEQLSVTIPVKTGEEGKLFGSVTVLDIVTAVEKLGHKLDRHQLQLDEPIKKTGKFDLAVKLHPEVTATLKVWIVEE